MNRKILFIVLFALIVMLFGVLAVDAQGPRPGTRSPRANAGTAFTYQGQLKKNGTTVNATCNFQFGLFADAGQLRKLAVHKMPVR